MDEGQVPQLRSIIYALLERTRGGRMEWEWDEVSESGIATLANGKVIVSKDRDFDTQIRIQDTDSNNLENINVGYLEYRDLKVAADELYELSRRSALKVDSKLESILREISA